jgi:hypothetical protein
MPTRTSGSLAFTLTLAVLSLASAASAQSTWRTVAETRWGRAEVTQRTDARSVASALKLTVGEIAGAFDAPPTVRQAWQDGRDRSQGGATFVATSRRVPIKGLITCRLTPRGALVAVITIRNDAPKEAWQQLMQPEAPAAPATAPATAASPLPAAARVPLRTYTFADGTGTLGLPAGWTTSAQSVMQGVFVQGPGDQLVGLALGVGVETPNSSLRRLPNTLVAPFATPQQTFAALVPQWSRQSVGQGGTSRVVDSLQTVQELPASMPNGRAALLTYGLTEASRAGSTHYLGLTQIELVPTSQTSFMVFMTQLRAPDASWARDEPVMLAIARSLKTNDDRVREVSGQALAAQNQWFASQQAAHRQQVESNDAYNRQWERDSNARSRGHDDFDEVLRGYRTVEDTSTGERRSVDLGNVDGVVDELNRGDPGRYQQIPLRDEADPVPRRR